MKFVAVQINANPWRIALIVALHVAVLATRNSHRTSNRGICSEVPSKMTSLARRERLNFKLDTKLLFITIMTAALTSTLPAISKASNESFYDSILLRPSVCILSPGYKIEVDQYRSMLYEGGRSTKSIILAPSENADSTIESLMNDAQEVLNEAKRLLAVDAASETIQNRVLSLLLMGHSRGGAVAALAGAIYFNTSTSEVKDCPPKGQKFLPTPTKILLVLLDPVDSAEGIVLKALRECFAAKTRLSFQDGAKSVSLPPPTRPTELRSLEQVPSEKFGPPNLIVDLISEACNFIWPWPVLIVSTPYGGTSSYYKTQYASACAPVDRNGDAFASEYNRLNMPFSEPLSSLSSPSPATVETKQLILKKNLNILHVRLPDVGHTQLLQNRKNSTFGSVCVANNKVSDRDVQGFISNLTRIWVNLSLNSESLYQTDLPSKMSEGMSELYPNIRAEWLR